MKIGLEFVAIIPPVSLNWLAFRAYDLDVSYIHLENPMGALVSIVIGLVIWAGIAWWLWKLTIRRFNALAGRRKVHVVDKTFAMHYAEFRAVASSQ